MSDVLAPVTKTRELPCTPAVAFTLFTDRMLEWWPIETHSVAGDRVRSLTVEPVVGGHVYETDVDGVRHDWATVLAHEPPHRLELAWYPGRSPVGATRVEICFTTSPAGCTLRLVHDGWAADEAVRHDSYETGWDLTLDPLVDLASQATL